MMNRDFKGIWIPKEIWLNTDLTVMEKLFLVEIDSLDQSVQGCFASNAHFSELFGVTKTRCSQIIKALEKKKLVEITLQREGKMIVKRVIRSMKKISHPFNILHNPMKNTSQPYEENVEGNNTNINNTKGGSSALDFLKLNYKSRYDVFLIQNKKQIKDFDKFCLDFNDTCDQEQLEFNVRVLFGRLGKYARNWIENQNRYQDKEADTQPTYLRKIL